MCPSHLKWPVMVLNRGRLVWPSNWKPIEFAFKTESNAGLHFKGTPRSVQSVPYFILPIIGHPSQMRLLGSEVDTEAKFYFMSIVMTNSLIWSGIDLKWNFAISRDLKIPDFPNFVIFGCKINDCSQTTNSHQYSL